MVRSRLIKFAPQAEKRSNALNAIDTTPMKWNGRC